jgi:hypothetical protein
MDHPLTTPHSALPKISDQPQSSGAQQLPPFPETLGLEKPLSQPEFDLLGEL